VLLRRVLDATHDLGEVRVGDVVDDHADNRNMALQQPARQRVGQEIERLGGGQHTLARGTSDGVRRAR
jgi:hypothetical protein